MLKNVHVCESLLVPLLSPFLSLSRANLFSLLVVGHILDEKGKTSDQANDYDWSLLNINHQFLTTSRIWRMLHWCVGKQVNAKLRRTSGAHYHISAIVGFGSTLLSAVKLVAVPSALKLFISELSPLSSLLPFLISLEVGGEKC